MINLIILLICSLILSSCGTTIQNTTDFVANIKETIAPAPSIIEKDGLPNKHLIKTAFIPQAPEKNWDQPWQDACEEASLLTLKYYYLNQTPDIRTLLSDYQQIFSYEDQNNWSHDLNLLKMSQVSTDLLNLKPNIISHPTVENIKEYIAKNIPVIITANGKTLYQENKHFKSGGPWYHSLVILGYDDTLGKFIVHDVGTQFGAYFKYSYSLLMDSIHDFPASNFKEDIDTGDKKILVLLK